MSKRCDGQWLSDFLSVYNHWCIGIVHHLYAKYSVDHHSNGNVVVENYENMHLKTLCQLFTELWQKI